MPFQLTPFQPPCQPDSTDGYKWNHERKLINSQIGCRLVRIRQGSNVFHENDICDCNQDAATNNGNTPQRLLRDMHLLTFFQTDQPTIRLNSWYGFHGHGIGHHILQHITERCQQGCQYIPLRQWRKFTHGLIMPEQPDHDEQTGRDQSCSQIDQQTLPAPHQIHQMTQRHFQRPGQCHPEAECCQKFC